MTNCPKWYVYSPKSSSVADSTIQQTKESSLSLGSTSSSYYIRIVRVVIFLSLNGEMKAFFN